VVDSVESAQEAGATPEWSAVLSDAKTFMDIERVVVAWAEENVGVRPADS
jgi:hypothetical protein